MGLTLIVGPTSLEFTTWPGMNRLVIPATEGACSDSAESQWLVMFWGGSPQTTPPTDRPSFPPKNRVGSSFRAVCGFSRDFDLKPLKHISVGSRVS